MALKEFLNTNNLTFGEVARLTTGLLPVNCDGDIRRADLIAYIQTHTLADKPLL